MPEANDPVLVLVCSVELEAAPVRAHLQESRAITVGRKAATIGRMANTPVLLLPAGMGKVNAAQGLTCALERYRVSGVVGFGVGGAYPGSGLSMGSLALARSEVYGDEGVATPSGWMSTEGIGIPLAEREGRRFFNEFPLDDRRVSAAVRILGAAGLDAGSGPFVTVSCCSGTGGRGEELASRFGAVCESMEGAAFAHVAELYGVPFLEVRGISNLVEDRDLSRWELKSAAEVAGRAVGALAANNDELEQLETEG